MMPLLLVGVALGLADADVARARQLERVAHDLQAAGKYADAEKPLLDAIALWKKRRADIEVLNDEMSLAVSYRRRGDAARALPILVHVEHDLGQSKDVDAPVMRRKALNNLSAAHRELEQYPAAIQDLERCLAAMQSGPPAEERARVLDNLASTDLDAGDLEAADRYAERGLAEWLALRGDSHPDTAIAMSNVGTLKMRRGRYDEARPLLERALHIQEKTHDAGHPDIAAVLNLLAELDLRTHHLVDARAEAQRSLAMSRKRLGDDHPLVKDARALLESIDAAK